VDEGDKIDVPVIVAGVGYAVGTIVVVLTKVDRRIVRLQDFEDKLTDLAR
jgi:hypothetical protein